MAEVIKMPRLSDTMEEGTVATWLKKVGDPVKEGDILAEIETDKATMEFESFYEGTLRYIGVKEGETATVDSLLAIIGDKDEDISALIDGKSTDKKEAAKNETDTSKENVKEQPKEAKTEASKDSGSGEFEIPEGVEIITMPRLSDTMEEGTVATWLKKEGDSVEEGDILAEIETDKATMEFESFYSGTLLKIGLGEGESAPVDALLAIIGPKGTDISQIAENYKKQAASTTAAEAEKPTSAADKKEEIAAPVAAATTESESKYDIPQTSNEGRIFASPLARKMAADRGVDLRLVKGSGENGRIVKIDIENYQPAVGGMQAYMPVGVETFEEIKNSQMRKTIAKRLSESKFTAPEYYLTVELDMDQTIAMRKSINSDPDVKISFNDIIIKACAMAIRKHPRVNSHWTPEVTKIAKHIHIGVAVAVDDGLLVPVLKFADQMSFMQIGAQVQELAEKSRTKKITPQEMEGSTFTVSNLGMFGINEFTSIINQPNSAILSVGAIVQKPVVKNGQLTVGNTMKITMACDHRTIDGATGAKFLQTLRQYIENPVTMFL